MSFTRQMLYFLVPKNPVQHDCHKYTELNLTKPNSQFIIPNNTSLEQYIKYILCITNRSKEKHTISADFVLLVHTPGKSFLEEKKRIFDDSECLVRVKCCGVVH